jgi:hypothetical protein
MGTRLYDSLIAKQYLTLDGADLLLTDAGRDFARDFGLAVDQLSSKKAPLCKECLDWSERRSHLAGSLGRAFLTRIEELAWAKRDTQTRIITFSKLGERQFEELLKAS